MDISGLRAFGAEEGAFAGLPPMFVIVLRDRLQEGLHRGNFEYLEVRTHFAISLSCSARAGEYGGIEPDYRLGDDE